MTNSIQVFGQTLELDKKYEVQAEEISNETLVTLRDKISTYFRWGVFSYEHRKVLQVIRSLPPRKTDCVYEGRSSRFLTQLSKAFQAEMELKFSDDLKRELGNIIASDSFSTLVFDFTQTFEWKHGDFGDNNSCFFGGRSLARIRIKDAGGFAIRFYHPQTKKGIGRAWAVWSKPEFEERLLVFNMYGASQHEFSVRVQNIFKGLFNLDLKYDCPSITINQNTTGLIYVNGTNSLFYNPATQKPITFQEVRDEDGDILDGLDIDLNNFYYVCAITQKRSNRNDEVMYVHPRYKLEEGYALSREIAESHGYGASIYSEMLVRFQDLLRVRRWTNGTNGVIQDVWWDKEESGSNYPQDMRSLYYDPTDRTWYQRNVPSTILELPNDSVVYNVPYLLEQELFRNAYLNKRKTKFDPLSMARYLLADFPDHRGKPAETVFEESNGVGLITVDSLEDFAYCFYNFMPSRLISKELEYRFGERFELLTNGINVWFNGNVIAKMVHFHYHGASGMRMYQAYPYVLHTGGFTYHFQKWKHNKGKESVTLIHILDYLRHYNSRASYTPTITDKQRRSTKAWWGRNYELAYNEIENPIWPTIRHYDDIRFWDTDERLLPQIIDGYKKQIKANQEARG